MKNILVYGSLRKDHYNFNRCGKQKFVKAMKLNGYDLFSLGSYPAILEGKGDLVVELHEVDDLTHKNIQRMELGAGYSEKPIEVDGVTASLYVFNNKNIAKTQTQVKSGDWSDFKKPLKF